MGSLPDLTERTRPLVRKAVRVVVDPNRNRQRIRQIPINSLSTKEWNWRHVKGMPKVPRAAMINRRRESVGSSAASLRRLISKRSPRLPPPLVSRYQLLCVAYGLFSIALQPFTALAGTEGGALALAAMHSVAAIIAPFSPKILQKTGTRFIFTFQCILLCTLLITHTIVMPLYIFIVLYALCGLTLSPMSLAIGVSATTLSQAASDDSKKRIVLRRALRALRAAQDIGLVCGSVLLGGALMIWPETPPIYDNTSSNISIDRWPSEQFLEDGDQEKTCGVEGCPEDYFFRSSIFNSSSSRIVLAFWSISTVCAAMLGAIGAAAPTQQPDQRSIIRDPRTLLGVPMGLFFGLQQGFMYTTYIRWYGVCVSGWSWSWSVVASAGLLAGPAAWLLSLWAAYGRRCRRALMLTCGAVAAAALLLALLRWRATRSDRVLPVVASAAWSAIAALWDVLQTGLIVGGNGWRGPWSIVLGARHIGMALAIAARALLCVRIQIFALMVMLGVATLSHLALELRTRGEARPCA